MPSFGTGDGNGFVRCSGELGVFKTHFFLLNTFDDYRYKKIQLK